MERREADGEGGTQEPGAKSSRLCRDKASEVLGRRGGRTAARAPHEGGGNSTFYMPFPLIFRSTLKSELSGSHIS